MLQQAISISLLAAMAATPSASSQGIRGTISGNAPMAAPAIRVLVATPYPSSPADSTAAVTIGNALRSKLSGNIGGSDWAVINRREMNDNLVKWGYAPDQVFQTESARQMVSAMQARMFVMTTMTKGPDGHFTASVRVTGASDEAGQVFKLAQLATQTLPDFGNKLADQVSNIFKAYPDAKQCNDNLTTNKPKAIEGANKAIKAIPNYGFPEYCLGLIERAKDSVGAETLRHFKNAIIGDPFSLKALSQISIIDQIKKDTVAVVADFQQMLRIAPTNRALADQAYAIFRAWGRPDAAEAVVDEQMKLDPSSPDWPDLKGNSCAAAGAGAAESNPALAKTKFACAYAAFVQVITLDPTRADTSFFPKIIYVAGTRADSMKWAKQWAEKYASSPDPLSVEMQLYTDAGQLDSAKQVVRLLSAIDPTDAKPVLALEQLLLKQKKYDDAISLAAIFPKGADAKQRDQFAGLLVQEGQVIVADTANKSEAKDSTLAHMGHAIVAANPPTPVYSELGNYFVVMSYVPGFTRMSTAARAEKSCDTATKYETLLTAMIGDPALKALGTATNASLLDFSGKLTTSVQSELTGAQGVPAMKKLFCKPPAKP